MHPRNMSIDVPINSAKKIATLSIRLLPILLAFGLTIRYFPLQNENRMCFVEKNSLESQLRAVIALYNPAECAIMKYIDLSVVLRSN